LASGTSSQAPRQEAGASLTAHHQRPAARYRRQGSRHGTIVRTATVSPGRTVAFLRIPRSHAQERLAMTLSSAPAPILLRDRLDHWPRLAPPGPAPAWQQALEELHRPGARRQLDPWPEGRPVTTGGR
jgi:hypothetical protein